jgi:hypothetical protein
VSLRDNRCPAEVRRALQTSGPNSGTLGSQDARLTERETTLN